MLYLFFYVLLAWALTQTFGVYDAGYVVSIAIGYIAMVGWVMVQRWRADNEGDAPACPRSRAAAEGAGRLYSKIGLAVMALFGAGSLALNPGIVYGQAGLWTEALRVVLIGAALGVAVYVVLAWLGRARWITTVFWLAVGSLITARALVLVASPSPYIDVFTLTNQASDFLLAGHNPYVRTYPDLYQGLYDYAAGPNYWPAYYLWSAVFRVAGDIRLGLVVAEAIVALLLSKVLASFELDQGLVRLATLAWLTFPISLYVIEQAWIEPVVVMFILLVAWLLRSRFAWRSVAVGLALGFASALKQYVPLFALLTLVLVWRVDGRKVALQTATWAAGAFAIILLPFLVADPNALFQQTVITYLARGLRPDGLSVPAWLANEFGLTLDTLVLGVVYALVIGVGLFLSVRWPEAWTGWAGGLAIAFGGLFIFGKQAFCNYYYLLALILLLAGLIHQRRATLGVAPVYR